ncbi:MAG: glutathione S-transferase N-terminal domain-containing protein [Burkholderiales bacterium]|nr:glutathione S-transferase N-terminal domain-containing protein [Burkholderiales bacterium]
MTIKLWDLAGAEDARRFSPHCWRVKMALRHKGLEVEEIPWRFTEKEAIAASKQGAVPVIEDQGHTLYDSWTISSYLDEAYPDRPLLFAGEEAKTLTFFFKHWVERSLHGPFFRVIVLDIERHLHPKDKAYFRSSREKRLGRTLEAYAGDPGEALAQLRAALDPLRPVLAESAFLAGRRPGFADYLLIAVFQWARAVSAVKLLEVDDPVYAWRERVMDLFGGYARNAVGYPV